MTVTLYCKECKTGRKHEVNQENGKIICHYCGTIMGTNRMVQVRHQMNKPKPKDYQGHKLATRPILSEKPRETISVRSDKWKIKNGIYLPN